MLLDRLVSNELTLNREQIAELLGLRRQSVTAAASMLQIANDRRVRIPHRVQASQRP